MTRRTILHCALTSAVAVAFLTAPASSAFADDNNAEDAIRAKQRKEILISSNERPREEAGWPGPNFQLHKRSGFSYTRHLVIAEKPFVFRIQGPLLRKQKAVGLAFKIRF